MRSGPAATSEAHDQLPPPLQPESTSIASGNRIVVTIGIDRYAAWPQLGNAVNDARSTSAVFRGLGFHEARSLINEAATGDAIRKLVTDELSGLGIHDSLVVFFAGHGGTKTQVLKDGTTIKTGYIIPVDAENKQGQVATWIRLDSWLDDIARLPAHHILVILDACHSGIALDALIKSRDVDTWRSCVESQLSRRRSRRVIVSALDDQVALDGGPRHGHSVFTGYLIQALTGGLPRDGRWVASGTELGLYLQTHVRDHPGSRQVPDFGAFDLDERGELMIPLFPTLSSIPPPPPEPEPDVNAALRFRLALLLGEFFPDRLAIARVIAAHAPTIEAVDLPDGPPATIWMYILVQLANQHSHESIAAIVEAARRCSRRSRRIDWSAYAVLFSQRHGSAIATWSHVTLSLRCDAIEADQRDTTLITDGATLLEADVTLRWGGIRPDAPLISVTSSQLFGRTQSLLHEITARPSTAIDSARWLVKIPLPRARIRTRRISVRCAGTALVERRYVVPRAGSIAATVVWLAFAVFAWYWLAPISRYLVTAPLTVFGVLSGLWSSVGVHLLGRGRNRRSFGSLLFAWELAAVSAVIVGLFVLLTPPRVVVLATNKTGMDVVIGGVTVPASASQEVHATSFADGQPSRPFCRCDEGRPDEPRCSPCELPDTVHHVHHIVIGCFAGDCQRDSQLWTAGGTALIKRTIDRTPPGKSGPGAHPDRLPPMSLTFAPGSADLHMKLDTDGTSAVELLDVKQLPDHAMSLPILPPQNERSTATSGFTLQFIDRGSLSCDPRAQHIVAIALDSLLDTTITASKTVNMELGGVKSKWAVAATGQSVERKTGAQLRACAAVPDPTVASFTIPGSGTLRCTGAQVAGLVAFPLSSPGATPWRGGPPLRLRLDGIESTWQPETQSPSLALACRGTVAVDEIELRPLAAGMQLTLPAEHRPTAFVRGDHADLVEVPGCNDGQRGVRGVSIDGISPSDPVFRAAQALVARVSPHLGMTCVAPTAQRISDNETCHLTTDRLSCETAYHGDCWMGTDGLLYVQPCAEYHEFEPGADANRARDEGRRRGIDCRRVYQCE